MGYCLYHPVILIKRRNMFLKTIFKSLRSNRRPNILEWVHKVRYIKIMDFYKQQLYFFVHIFLNVRPAFVFDDYD